MRWLFVCMFGAALLGAPSRSAAQAPDLVYKPVFPCRLIDTRKTTRIPANTARTFFISGNENYLPQGGPRDGCGVPTYATAIAISLTATSAASSGYLIPYAFGASRPNVVAVSYHASAPASTAATTPAIRNGKLTIYASGATHVLGDVTGYYAPQIAAYIAGSGQIADNTGRILSVDRSQTGRYLITADRDISTCIATASPAYASNAVTVIDKQGNTFTVYMFQMGISSGYMNFNPSNAEFFVNVTC